MGSRGRGCLGGRCEWAELVWVVRGVGETYSERFGRAVWRARVELVIALLNCCSVSDCDGGSCGGAARVNPCSKDTAER